MTEYEGGAFFKKYRDKDGAFINLGDELYGEDGRKWYVAEVRYGKSPTPTYPIVCKGESPYKEYFGATKELKPKWLSRNKPNPHRDFVREMIQLVSVPYPPTESRWNKIREKVYEEFENVQD